jgi:hypothetical protein
MLNAIGAHIGGVLPIPALGMEAVNFVVSFGVVTLLFAAIFKILPDVDNAWSDVWIGAVVTAALFTVGKSLIGVYIGRMALDSTYGTAASLLVVLVWIYYSSLILFFGAEFTHVYARRRGSQVGPRAESGRPQDGLRASWGDGRAVPSTRQPDLSPSPVEDLLENEDAAQREECGYAFQTSLNIGLKCPVGRVEARRPRSSRPPGAKWASEESLMCGHLRALSMVPLLVAQRP